ncbi:MAG: NAD(P)H-hydrate dehydratase [Caldilineaceae bacterium]|nr:NAD(P)H-hydrate dehydratase [Caldilineaceae bacterium]
MKVSSVAQMRGMDRKAIDEDGIPELLLMENAGLAAVQVIVDHYAVRGQRWLVLCGVGNNGGDGLVVARQLHSRGAQVIVVLLGDPARFGEAAAANLVMVRALRLPLIQPSTVDPILVELAASDGVVDGLLGTGISRAVEGLFAEVIAAVNTSHKPVVSLDIASGVNGDTGQVMGVAVQAAHTITFGLPKAGNLLYPGYGQGGRLWVSHIGFAPGLYADDGLQMATNDPVTLPSRAVQGHKGTFGDTLFVAGAGSYYGAPYFSALACMKAGGGYVRLATPASVAAVVAARAGELVFLPQEETDSQSIAEANRQRLLDMAAKLDFVVIGPGTSLHEETQTLLRDLVAGVEKPLLIDGDGISAISHSSELLRQRTAPTVLTPHTGEFARLTGLDSATIEQDRVGALRLAAANLKAVIVLKGAHSLIGYPDGRVYINMSGNSGMATAGSGDVLTGTIAAMAGLGLVFDDAVRMGVFVHGLAGDLAAAAKGEDGMTAQDVLEALPQAVRACREGSVGRYLVKEVG